MNKYPIRLRAFFYAAAVFLTPFIDKIGPILEKDEWPSPQRIVLCLILGTAASVVVLRAFYDGSAERAKLAPPRLPVAGVVGTILLASFLLTGCATAWIDKVSQTRAAIVKAAYRGASEFNAWIRPRTNNPAAFNTTYDSLMARWTNVDRAAHLVGDSAQILEWTEDAYRAAPTNKLPVIEALNELSLHSSNITAILRETQRCLKTQTSH